MLHVKWCILLECKIGMLHKKQNSQKFSFRKNALFTNLDPYTIIEYVIYNNYRILFSSFFLKFCDLIFYKYIK